jgi:hypothetical protein
MKFILPVLLLSPVLLSLKKDPKDVYIDWSSKRLEWSDYLSEPDPQSDAAATTTTYLGVEYKITKNVFSYKIACRFSKEKSWGIYKTAYILAHEQGHFDITEIFARQLNQRLGEYQFNKRTFEKDLKKIYEDVMREKEDFQRQYDEETDYSRNKKMQFEWLEKIEKILEQTDLYKNYESIAQNNP